MHRYLKNGFGGVFVVCCLLAQTAFATIPAGIRILPVSPRLRDQATSDVYDVKSSGLDVVGVNQRVYLVPAPDPAYATSITDCVWTIPTQPSPGTAVVDSNTSGLLKFHPSVQGTYVVQMVPYVSGSPSTPTTQQIVAAKFVGTGKELTSGFPAYPQCGMGCHTDKIDSWWGTDHAHKLENHLNHKYGSYYSQTCLECHTVGFDKVATGNDNFYEKSQAIAFDLNQIVTWVADTTTSHWPDLPNALRIKSNIQCESCHGPGNIHGGDTTKIAHGQYDGNVCRQCHDSASGHQQKVWQWEQSKHSGEPEAHMTGNTTCQKCHTAEGFVAITVDGGSAIPPEITSRNNVTCVACHDPHSAANEHMLRKVSAVTLPNGFVYDGGLGNVCANCHNSRISNVRNTINTSFRGAHRGPQSDVMLGLTAYEWGTSYPATVSPHYLATTDTCVSCHMADAPAGATPPAMGSHTFAIDAGTSNNVQRACVSCHPGLTTTDRVPLTPVDFDGDGAASGIQTEVRHLLANLRTPLLLLPGTTYTSDTERIDIASSSYTTLTFNQKAALYNYNLCASEHSHGVHNSRFVIAVSQRSYFYATGHYYKQDFPLANVLDSGKVGVTGGPLNFGNQDVLVGPTAAQSVTISNSGLSVLSFPGAGFALTGANGDQFAFGAAPDTTPLLPGTSRTVSVVFDPYRTGAISASLTITTDDPASPTVNVALSGTGTGTAGLPSVAGISILAVSPRIRDQSTTDVYDVKSSGLDVVGINERVYLVPNPDSGYATSITNCVWSVSSQPSPGAAVVDYDTSGLFKFHPAAGGEYVIQMIPSLLGAPSTPTTQRIYAAQYVGTGKEVSSPLPGYPQCGMGCHTDKINDWWGTGHAHILEGHLNHKYGTDYSTSCLECHTLGYSEVATGNNNFYEKAQQLSFDLNQIPTWVADTTTSHWPDLPGALRIKSNIQCEACHGPGSAHGGDTTRIAHGQYSATVCFQCHDEEGGTVWQWQQAKHSSSNLEASWKTNTTCQKCHTAEGFVAITVDGGTGIPPDITSRNNVTCVACHDPHSAANDCQLRTVAAVTLPNGSVFNGGKGNLCANCHNSRVVNPLTTINTSYRGAHRSPVADILLGTSAYDWGVRYPAGASHHYSSTTETCVSCHMAPAPPGATPAAIGDHTWALDDGTTNNAQRACAGCHPGLDTLDRVPLIPVDYDGDGLRSGIQTEVRGLLANVRAPLLLLPGTTFSSETERVDITSSAYSGLPFNTKAALYNYNLCASEHSHGVHNSRYDIAVLQRSYLYLTGHPYQTDYPLATVLDVPAIAVMGTPVAFGGQDVLAGPTAPRTITVQNNGTTSLTFTGPGYALAGANAGEFAIIGTPVITNLAPGSSRTVSVAFDPLTAGPKSAVLRITSNDPATSIVDVALTGTGLDRVINAVPASLSFGGRDILAGPTAPQTVTIHNDGTAPLNFTGLGIVLAGTHANQFQITNNPPKTPLAPGTTRDVTIQFDPSTSGPKTAALRITTDDADKATVNVALAGTGLDRVITLTPTSVALGSQDIDLGRTAGQTVTIKNTGTAPLNFTGAGIVLAGANAGEFAITNNPAKTPLAPGASRGVTVAFDPSSVGAKSAVLRVTSDDQDKATQDVALTGTGADQQCSVTPGAVAFGARPINAGPTAPRTVTIRNVGTAPMKFLNATLGGTGAKQFVIASKPPAQTVVAPGASVTATVTFDPDSLGAKSATLSIATDDTHHTPTVNVPLTGTGAKATAARGSWTLYR